MLEHQAATQRLLVADGQGPIAAHVLRWTQSRRQYLAAMAVIAGVTVAALFLNPVVGYRAISFIYLLAVVVMASFVGRGPTLLAAMVSALLWDFLFELPLYSFRIASVEDQILFGLYFVVALVLGQLTARIRAQEQAERQRGERATTLYLLSQELSGAAGLDEMLQSAMQHLQTNIAAEAAFLLADSNGRLELQRHPSGAFQLDERELEAARWAYEHGRPAGKFMGNLPQGGALFLPLVGGHSVLGVTALRWSQPFAPTTQQLSLLEGFAQQIALAVEHLEIRRLVEQAKLFAESERLAKTLLNSISHEIRTPLAVIEAASIHLVDFQKADLPPAQRTMIAEIREATERLNRLVGNVLGITRLESGHVRPRLDYHDPAQLVKEAVAESRKTLARHQMTVEIETGLPFVPMDITLMHQALMNLLSNAAFHTPTGTEIALTASYTEGNVVIQVADRGRGVDPDCLGRLFNKFYRTPTASPGGTGLGLSIVKGFVEAQGGTVKAEIRMGGGMIFTIMLPSPQPPSDMPEREISHQPVNLKACL